MAKNSKKKPGASRKAAYTSYKVENRQEKNKIRKLERHIKRNEKDIKAKKALDAILQSGNTYKRRVKSRASSFEPKNTPLQALVERLCKTGAIVEVKGKVEQKPLLKPKRVRKQYGMELALELVGIKRGRLPRKMR